MQYLGDHITARDVSERITELEDEAGALAEAGEPTDEIEAELTALRAFYDAIPNDETLIADEAFTDYARDLASDLHGKAIDEAAWPFTCIDWERAASELQHDYTSYEFDDTTYWARA